MRTFLEGLSVVVQPCTLVIALPAIALVLAARDRAVHAAAGSVAATAMVMWARAAGHWTISSTGLSVVVMTLLILGAFALAFRSTSARRVVASATMGGAVAGWLWQPCVGEELGTILRDAQAGTLRSMGGLGRLGIYTSGALLPVVILALVPHAWPTTKRVLHSRQLSRIGAALGTVYAVTVLSGRYDNVIAELSRWSAV